ncbi:hypothetical protein [Natrinema pallidum]|uniref:hypothetical protein n=1 Tax=Natrinema pallidum TaxID=69527 RepID=UPI001268A688|nr:hypothetical protein [Natrinema pallidum]
MVDNYSIEDVFLTSIILIVGLVFVIPIFALWKNISLLILVPIAGIFYSLYLYTTNRVFSGIVSSFFILSIFNADIPIVRVPTNEVFSLYLVDPIAIGLFVVLGYGFSREIQDARDKWLGVIAVFGLTIFVLWSYLAAVIGNGPSQSAAMVFSYVFTPRNRRRTVGSKSGNSIRNP